MNSHIPRSALYPNMRHFVAEMCTRVYIFLLQNWALWDIGVMHRGMELCGVSC